jgi:flavin reductase (DIM6/NTAB) family NADH-FMN oxidoreductase RutF
MNEIGARVRGAGIPQALDARGFRDAMGKFATGVSVVSYWRDGQPAGLTANAFTSVSLDPPLVLVSIRNQSRFLAGAAIGDRYAVNFLAHDQQAISDHFGGRPDDVAPAPFQRRHGVPVVEGSLASIVARVVDLHPAGDHTLVIGQVEHLDERSAAPLVYFRGRSARLAVGEV